MEFLCLFMEHTGWKTNVSKILGKLKILNSYPTKSSNRCEIYFLNIFINHSRLADMKGIGIK